MLHDQNITHNTSPSNDANCQKEAENHSLEASPSNIVEKLRAHHMIASGQHPDKWQAGTTEASSSELDRPSARQQDISDISLYKERLIKLDIQEQKEILDMSANIEVDNDIIEKIIPIMGERKRIISKLQQKYDKLHQNYNELQREYNELHQEYTILGEGYQKLNEFLKEQVKSDQKKQEKIQKLQEERYSLLDEKSQNEREILKLRQNLADQQKQADQEKKDLEKTIQELQQRLAIKQEDSVTSTSATSPLEKGEASTTSSLEKGEASGTSPLEKGEASATSSLEKGEASGTSSLEKGEASATSPLEKGEASGTSSLEKGEASATSPLEKGEASGTSSLEKGEASSSPTGCEVVEGHAEQKLRELWNAVNDAKLFDDNKMEYLDYGLCAFILSTDPAKRWLMAKGYNEILKRGDRIESVRSYIDDYIRCGRMKDLKEEFAKYHDIIKYANEFIRTPDGKAWLSSDDGQKFMSLKERGLIFNGTENINDELDGCVLDKMIIKDNIACFFVLKTREGINWCKANGYNSIFKMNDNELLGSEVKLASQFLSTAEGKAWLKSEYGQKFRQLMKRGLVVCADYWE
jgi:hypothetical protein